jgi:hypothetical protein
MRARTHCQEKNACPHVYLCGILWAMAKEKKLTLSEFARIGGKARARKLTPEQRKASARKAAQARWAKERKAQNG